MHERTVLTAIGDDRPGLVEEVSAFVLGRGGSIEDSRMANMHGQFAIMMLIGGSRDTLDSLEAELELLRSQTALHAQLTPAVRSDAGSTPRLPYRLTGRALDQTGLVHQVANVLRSLQINIERMETTLERRR